MGKAESCNHRNAILQDNNIIRDEEGLFLGRMNKSVERTTIDAKEQCSTCRFWCACPTNQDAAGECRRNAPQVFTGPEDEAQSPIWPCTRPDDWCGEWEAKK